MPFKSKNNLSCQQSWTRIAGSWLAFLASVPFTCWSGSRSNLAAAQGGNKIISGGRMMPLTWLSLSLGEFERMFPFVWDGVTKLLATPLYSLTSAARHCSLPSQRSSDTGCKPQVTQPTSFKCLPTYIPTDRVALSHLRDGNRGASLLRQFLETLAVPRSHSSVPQTKHEAPADSPWIIYLVRSMALL